MKTAWIGAGLFAAFVGGAEARNIEDILEQKGTISDAEASEAKAAREKREAPPAAALPDWLSKVTLFGDVRIRNESFFRKKDPDRARQRFRLRFGARVAANKEMELGFGLASGSASDPISNNQTFTDTFTFKSINISQAYVKVAPTTSFAWARPYVTLMAGKYYTPLYTPTRLVFDPDLTPEGFSESLKPVEETSGFLRGVQLNFGQWVYQEISRTSDGSMFPLQGVAAMALGDDVLWNVGVGDYIFHKPSTIAAARNSNNQLNITNTVKLSDGTVVGGKPIDPTKFGPNKDGKDANGKPITITKLVSEFNELNFASDVTVRTGMPAWPLKVFGDYVINTKAAGSQDTGFQIGIGIGATKDPGDLNFTYAYQRLETDAVISAFTDSDFGHDGGTNTKAHILQLTYVVMKNLQLTSTTWIDKPVRAVAGRSNETDYRWQIDLLGKF